MSYVFSLFLKSWNIYKFIFNLVLVCKHICNSLYFSMNNVVNKHTLLLLLLLLLLYT
jgi:hypothetical protein